MTKITDYSEKTVYQLIDDVVYLKYLLVNSLPFLESAELIETTGSNKTTIEPWITTLITSIKEVIE